MYMPVKCDRHRRKNTPRRLQVVITHVLCSVRNVTQVFSEVNRVLKPGGKIFLVRVVNSRRPI